MKPATQLITVREWMRMKKRERILIQRMEPIGRGQRVKGTGRYFKPLKRQAAKKETRPATESRR